MENSLSQQQINKYNELANTTNDPTLKNIFMSILDCKEEDLTDK